MKITYREVLVVLAVPWIPCGGGDVLLSVVVEGPEWELSQQVGEAGVAEDAGDGGGDVVVEEVVEEAVAAVVAAAEEAAGDDDGDDRGDHGDRGGHLFPCVPEVLVGRVVQWVREYLVVLAIRSARAPPSLRGPLSRPCAPLSPEDQVLPVDPEVPVDRVAPADNCNVVAAVEVAAVVVAGSSAAGVACR